MELAQRIEAGLYADFKLKELLANGGIESSRQARDYALLKREDALAKKIMTESNLGLVIKPVYGFRSRLWHASQQQNMSIIDLISEGNLRVIRAVEKFDYTKGNKFSNYAMHWISAFIVLGIHTRSRTIYVPPHVNVQLDALYQSLKQERLG